MDKLSPKTEINTAERAQIFFEQYGNDFDGAAALPDFIIAAGDYISRIVGQETTDAGMALIVQGVVNTSGHIMHSPGDWREALKDSSSSCYSEWPIGEQLFELAAYAEYGIVLDGDGAMQTSDAPKVLAGKIKTLLDHAQELEASTPIAQWQISASNELSRLVMVARNRWALDNNQPVEPAALAHFGGISEGRIRNMMSGAERAFTPADGRIPVAEAQKWLQGRPEFWNSIWKEQSLVQYDDTRTSPLQQPVFVPVARDGTLFNPGLQRAGSYTIGKRGEEERVADFNAALDKLHRMPVAYWRRPNDKGNWGIVVADHWERVDATDFKIAN
ncbi:hypothetical protein [Tardiphaga sp.]|uniref:hypothetical protein n=1 Tax=Tardiphaga sp. TaxID=1926292 RepID=UPI0025D2B1F2|nr:hypothetical protein [Tardiphaga sp.]